MNVLGGLPKKNVNYTAWNFLKLQTFLSCVFEIAKVPMVVASLRGIDQYALKCAPKHIILFRSHDHFTATFVPNALRRCKFSNRRSLLLWQNIINAARFHKVLCISRFYDYEIFTQTQCE